MWKGLWVPALLVRVRRARLEDAEREVTDQLIEIFAQAETLTAVEIGRAEAFRGRCGTTFSELHATYDIPGQPTLPLPPFPLDRFAPSARWPVAARQLLGWLLT